MSRTVFNNYDTSSTMEDCELHVMRDCDLARIDFEEEFKVLQHSGYSTTALYFYIDCGNCDGPPDYPSECYDFSKCSEKDFRAFVWEKNCETEEYYKNQFPTWRSYNPYRNAREMVNDMLALHGSWKDYAISIIDDETVASYVKGDDFPDIPNAELLVETTSVTGYSQGDYADILFWKSSIWDSVDDKGNPLPRAEIISNMRSHFHHIVYDQRVYCSLEVDGTEYRFEEYMKDTYGWEKDEILTISREQFKLGDRVVEWLESNLPDYPEAV